MLNFIFKYLSIDFISNNYNLIMSDVDYIFSNIIGPPIDKISDSLNINITNIHFFITPKCHAISFNSISSGNNINIVCSFNKCKNINKKRFKKCIYKAYNSLINSYE